MSSPAPFHQFGDFPGMQELSAEDLCPDSFAAIEQGAKPILDPLTIYKDLANYFCDERNATIRRLKKDGLSKQEYQQHPDYVRAYTLWKKVFDHNGAVEKRRTMHAVGTSPIIEISEKDITDIQENSRNEKLHVVLEGSESPQEKVELSLDTDTKALRAFETTTADIALRLNALKQRVQNTVHALEQQSSPGDRPVSALAQMIGVLQKPESVRAASTIPVAVPEPMSVQETKARVAPSRPVRVVGRSATAQTSRARDVAEEIEIHDERRRRIVLTTRAACAAVVLLAITIAFVAKDSIAEAQDMFLNKLLPRAEAVIRPIVPPSVLGSAPDPDVDLLFALSVAPDQVAPVHDMQQQSTLTPDAVAAVSRLPIVDSSDVSPEPVVKTASFVESSSTDSALSVADRQAVASLGEYYKPAGYTLVNTGKGKLGRILSPVFHPKKTRGPGLFTRIRNIFGGEGRKEVTEFHNGVDYAVEKGTPQFAGESGVVIKASVDDPRHHYGVHVVIQCNNGMKLIYAHLDKLCVWEGKDIERGEQIGETGNTGHVRGSNGGFHAHVVVLDENGKVLDASKLIDMNVSPRKHGAKKKDVLAEKEVAHPYSTLVAVGAVGLGGTD